MIELAKRQLVFLAFILAPSAWPTNGLAQPARQSGDAATVAALEQTFVDVIARAERSVVAIARSTPAGPAARERSAAMPPVDDLFGDLRQSVEPADATTTTAAGVIIDPAGLVLTEFLAVRAGDRHTVTTVDGAEYPATIKATDPRSGLAVLSLARSPARTPASSLQPGENRGVASSLQRTGNGGEPTTTFPAIPLGDASQLRKGQFAIAIGNPYAIRTDGEPTASWGIITNLARKAPTGANLNDVPGALGDYRTTIHHLGTLVQTDARLGWSAGGGALVNLRGELVGLTTTVGTIAGHEQPAGYAIPLDPVVRRIVDTLREGREVEYGLLGVTFRQRDAVAAGQTSERVVIAQVVPGSPAARAGLQPGDVIREVAGRRADDVDAIQLAISTIPPSQPVSIGIERANRATTVTATLAKLSVPGPRVVTDRPPSWRGMRIDYATAIDQQVLAERIASGGLDQGGSVAVTEVEPDSPAWRAGMRPGMFISHVGTERVTSPAEFQAAVETAGETWHLRLTEPVEADGSGASTEIELRAAE